MDELLEYLKNDLAHAKVQSELARRQSTQYAMLTAFFGFLLLMSILAFSITTLLAMQEQTKQIQSIFSANLEITDALDEKKTVVDMEVSGEGAVNNYNKADNHSQAIQNVNK